MTVAHGFLVLPTAGLWIEHSSLSLKQHGQSRPCLYCEISNQAGTGLPHSLELSKTGANLKMIFGLFVGSWLIGKMICKPWSTPFIPSSAGTGCRLGFSFLMSCSPAGKVNLDFFQTGKWVALTILKDLHSCYSDVVWGAEFSVQRLGKLDNSIIGHPDVVSIRTCSSLNISVFV